MSRLIYLKGKLQRDMNYHQEYIEFMDELIDKGYAEEPMQDLSLNNRQV